ncbi:MAG: hypothetical protein ACREFN_17325 [Acetobacteraceae bacterium]
MRVAFGLVLLALALAGCAAPSKAVAPAAAHAAAPWPLPAVGHAPGEVSYGTIIAERAADAPAGAAAIDLRSSILTAIGAPGPAALSGGDPAIGNQTEFIIREDDGGTISVVAGDATRFRRGQRVMIIRGPETKLAPLGQA